MPNFGDPVKKNEAGKKKGGGWDKIESDDVARIYWLACDNRRCFDEMIPQSCSTVLSIGEYGADGENAAVGFEMIKKRSGTPSEAWSVRRVKDLDFETRSPKIDDGIAPPMARCQNGRGRWCR